MLAVYVAKSDGSVAMPPVLTRTNVLVPVVPLSQVMVSWLVPMAVSVRLLAAAPGLTAMVVWLAGLPEAEFVL